jgi:SagB-type dehydrogenase family enzyme
MWKYGHSHAYRVLLLDAGHLGQTFHLVCTAMGLGPFTTAALDGSAVELALGLDGIREIAVYAGSVGWPKAEVRREPFGI